MPIPVQVQIEDKSAFSSGRCSDGEHLPDHIQGWNSLFNCLLGFQDSSVRPFYLGPFCKQIGWLMQLISYWIKKFYLLPILAQVAMIPAFCEANDLEADMRVGIRLAKEEVNRCELVGAVAWKSNPDLTYPFKLPQGTAFSVVGNQFCLIKYKSEKGAEADVVQALNDRYAFSISKSITADIFSLRNLYSRSDRSGIEPIMAQRQGLDNFLFAHYQLKFHWLWDALDDPGFEVREIKKVETELGEFVKVHFCFDPQRPRLSTQGFDRRLVGYFICDPSQMWAITECFIKDEENAPYGALRKIQLGEGYSTLPMPVKVEYYGASGSVTQDDVPEITNEWKEIGTERIEVAYSDAEIDTSEFYLSYYGLPEPRFANRFFTGWFVYFLAGTGLLLVGLFFYRWSRTK
jgi:hypothetical protein